MTIWVLDSSVDLVDIKTLLGKKKNQARQRERGNVRVIVFGAFSQWLCEKKIRGHEHRKERPKYFVIKGFVCKVWKLKH